MKHLFLSIFVVFGVLSCSTTAEKVDSSIPKVKQQSTLERLDAEVFVVEVDGCEYVIYDGFYSGGIVHKNNCKNCTNFNTKF